MDFSVLIEIVLGALVAVVGYWAWRLDARVDEMEGDIAALREKLPETYARRDDMALSRAELREELIKINEKLDRLIEKERRG